MGIELRRVQPEKLCGTISANGKSNIYCLCYGYFPMQKHQHTLITLGNLNLPDGCRKCVRRDSRWLEDNVIAQFSGGYIWCRELRRRSKDIEELTQFLIRFTHREEQHRDILCVVNLKKFACIRIELLQFSRKGHFFDQLISDQLCRDVDIGKICTKKICLE